MAEAVALASGLITLVATAYTACRKLNSNFDCIIDAPEHVEILTSDLQALYTVLGTLQNLLDDEECSAGLVEQAVSGNLSNVLKDCLRILKDINAIISEYQAHGKNSITTWQRLKWNFKEPELKELRKDLIACKATFNMAIALANYYNTRVTRAATERVEIATERIQADMAAHRQELEKLPGILQELEERKASQIPPAQAHGASDRAGVRVDYNFALRHYIDEAASISTGLMTPMAPSLQVSSLGTMDGRTITTFHTAPTSHTGDAMTDRSKIRECTQVFVRNVGLHKTMAIQVKPEYTIGTIKELVRQRTSLPDSEFELICSSRVLRTPEKSIEEYNIPHDATLTCVSFRPNNVLPSVPSSCWVEIRTFTHRKMTFEIDGHSLVDLKRVASKHLFTNCLQHELDLMHADKILDNGLSLSENGITDGAVIFAVERWPGIKVVVLTLYGIQETFTLKYDESVLQLKKLLSEYLDNDPPPDKIDVTYKGEKLQSHMRLCEYRIGPEATVFAVAEGLEKNMDDSGTRRVSLCDEAIATDQKGWLWKAPFGVPWLPKRKKKKMTLFGGFHGQVPRIDKGTRYLQTTGYYLQTTDPDRPYIR